MEIIWMLLGIILLIGEVLTPTFMMGCFVLGCFAAGVAAWFEFGLLLQITFFILVNLLVFLTIRPFFLNYLYNQSDARTNVDALVGKRGYVSVPITAPPNQGRVIVGGEDWKGISANGTPIESGVEIQVLQVDGVKLIVAPIHSNHQKGTE